MKYKPCTKQELCPKTGSKVKLILQGWQKRPYAPGRTFTVEDSDPENEQIKILGEWHDAEDFLMISLRGELGHEPMEKEKKMKISDDESIEIEYDVFIRLPPRRKYSVNVNLKSEGNK